LDWRERIGETRTVGERVNQWETRQLTEGEEAEPGSTTGRAVGVGVLPDLS
jgi:hypothetical protein